MLSTKGFLLACLLFGLVPAVSAGPAPKEEIVETVTLGKLSLSAGNVVRDPLMGDLEGCIYAEKAGGKTRLLQRKGAVVGTFEAADLGGGPMLAVGWVGGGKARYVVPELYREGRGPDGAARLEKVWGPLEQSPLQEGEVRIEEAGGKSRLVLEETLTYHSHVPPHLTKTTTWSWKDGMLVGGEPQYGETTTPHQKCNLAYEFYSRGDHKRSLRLYLESIQEGEKEMLKEDPELAAALHYAAAANFDKLGELHQQRVYLDKVANGWPDSSYARKAAEKLMQLKAKELAGP